MSKVANIVLVLRVIQTGLGITFLVFWIWSCLARFVIGGGIGNYVFGYISALLSLTISTHGIYSFAKKHHLKPHSALYHNARWALDMLVMGMWLGVILIEVLVDVPPSDWNRELNGASIGPNGQFPDATAPIMVVGLGVNITELFEGITFFMTGLLLIIPAVKARKGRNAVETETEVVAEAEPAKPDTTTGGLEASSSQAPRELEV